MDMREQELEILLTRCALRDAAALKSLYERTAGYLNAIAFRLMKSQDLSNDVLQEAFVQIWMNAANYRVEQAKPLTWMSSIVRYRALDRLAKEQRHCQRELTDGNLADLENVSGEEEPERVVHNEKVNAIINICLSLLTERNRRCIELAYLEGHSREELANLFNTNINTIKSWLHRSADRLKQCLETKLAHRS